MLLQASTPKKQCSAQSPCFVLHHSGSHKDKLPWNSAFGVWGSFPRKNIWVNDILKPYIEPHMIEYGLLNWLKPLPVFS